ncbi:MAG: acyl-CoA dehydrogenase family protein [Burkholderiales bacterium]
MTTKPCTDGDTIDMLRDSVARYAADRYDFLQRHAVLADACGYSAGAWADYAEYGWLALRLPEEAGGIDADPTAIGAVMEIVGARLLMEPLLASTVLGTGLVLRAGSAAQQARLLPALADGSLKLAFASDEGDSAETDCVLRGGRLHGSRDGVLHGDIADRVIVGARNVDVDRDAAGAWSLCLVDAADVQRRNYRMVDGRGAANLRFDGCRVERLDAADASEAIAAVRDEAAVALCAEALGVVRSLVATTCAYLKVRKQFGRTIGSYQTLQHRMVDMFLLQEEIRALTRSAQRALHGPVAERARIVSGAKAYIGGAVRHVANEAVQMHGGLGITDELDVSHYFRRAMVINALFGSRDSHFARFVDATLADA